VVQKCDVSGRPYSSKNIRKVGSIGFSQNFLSLHEQITLLILICKLTRIYSMSTINRTGGHRLAWSEFMHHFFAILNNPVML
jgi:hypothetical protein